MKLLLFNVSLLLAIATSASAADIVFRERVAPTGAVLRLGEIASVTNVAPDELERLASLPLTPAPAPGTEQVIRAQEIRDLLVAHGVDLADLRFDGATTITIGASVHRAEQSTTESDTSKADSTPAPARQQSGYRLVTQAPSRLQRNGVHRSPRRVTGAEVAELKQGLQESITQFVQATTGDELLYSVGLDLLSRNAASLAEATDRVKIATTSPISLGRQRFLVSFTTPSGPVRFPVFSEVQQATHVVVAIRSIPRGATITAADVQLKPVADDKQPRGDDRAMLAIEDVLGREARRALQPGQPLTDANCLPPLLVRRGDLVQVTAGGGGVTVRRTFEARRDGRLGEMVEVESPDDNQRLSARVVGPRELAIVSVGVGSSSYLTPNHLSSGFQPQRIR